MTKPLIEITLNGHAIVGLGLPVLTAALVLLLVYGVRRINRPRIGRGVPRHFIKTRGGRA